MSIDRENIIQELFDIKPNFLIGAGGSAHQIEGGNNNDWTVFERLPGKIDNSEVSGKATDHYNRYESDFEILQGLGLKVHRLSIEWSRIFPEEDRIDISQIVHYRNVLRALESHKQKRIVTLHHFTSPNWFIEIGGFKRKENLQHWERFVNTISKELGDFIDAVITINEPLVYCLTAYLQGIHAPGEKNLISYIRVANNLLRAHYLAVDIVRSYHPNLPVGITKNLVHFRSRNRNPINKIVTWFSDWGFNRRFNKSIKNARIPFGIGKSLGNDPGDFVGINYYMQMTVGLRFPDLMIPHKEGDENLTQMGWGAAPSGMFEEIKKFVETVDLPLIITENGIATDDDKLRVEYITAHLNVIVKLLKLGIDIRGYVYWSFIDNFEWEKGYSPKFGLISFDKDTYERHVKKSGVFLGNIAKKAENIETTLDF